jgi:hypothetical protein
MREIVEASSTKPLRSRPVPRNQGGNISNRTPRPESPVKKKGPPRAIPNSPVTQSPHKVITSPGRLRVPVRHDIETPMMDTSERAVSPTGM